MEKRHSFYKSQTGSGERCQGYWGRVEPGMIEMCGIAWPGRGHLMILAAACGAGGRAPDSGQRIWRNAVIGSGRLLSQQALRSADALEPGVRDGSCFLYQGSGGSNGSPVVGLGAERQLMPKTLCKTKSADDWQSIIPTRSCLSARVKLAVQSDDQPFSC